MLFCEEVGDYENSRKKYRLLMDLSIRKLLIATVVAALLSASVVSLIAFFAGYPSFPPALFAAVIIGSVALYLLAKDVEMLLQKKGSIFFAARLIFRLACFAILLYLLLVKFRLNLLGVIVGLTLPTVCMSVVLLYTAYRRWRS